MITVKGTLCLEETVEDIFDYLGDPCPSQLRYLRKRYKLPFVKVEGKRVYPLPDVNKWILGERAPLHSIDKRLQFLAPSEAAVSSKKSLSTLAHYRSDGAGPPFYRVGFLVRYLQADLIKWSAAIAPLAQE